VEDDEFWAFQARSLAVLATPDGARTWRLPNRLTESLEIADRFHIKPLIRAATFPHEALVLILAAGGARVLEISPDLPPRDVTPADMPSDAEEAFARAPRRRSARISRMGEEGRKVMLTTYARRVDAALRPLLAGRDTPLILLAAQPLDGIFRALCSYPRLLKEGLGRDLAEAPDARIAEAAAGLLAAEHARELEALRARFEDLVGASRATTEVSEAARAATWGAIDTLIVDMDAMIPGTVDEEDGAVTLAETPGPETYDVLDEIAGRALRTGARVISARREDVPHGADLAAFLRRPV